MHALARPASARTARASASGRALHLGIQSRLAEPLLEHARGMQQLVGNDGVVHAHAAFVEHAQDGLVALQARRPASRRSASASAGNLELRQRLHVAGVVHQMVRRSSQRFSPLQKEIVGEIFAPQRVVVHAGLGQRSVEIEHADQAGPFAAPVGDGQDRALMRIQPVQHMMTVLPDGLHHHQRRGARDIAKNLHAVLLAVDEAVLLGGIEWMAAPHLAAGSADGRHDGCFHAFLRRPAFWLADSRKSPLATITIELGIDSSL